MVPFLTCPSIQRSKHDFFILLLVLSSVKKVVSTSGCQAHSKRGKIVNLQLIGFQVQRLNKWLIVSGIVRVC